MSIIQLFCEVHVVSRGSRSSFSVKPLKVPDSAFHEPGIAGSPRIDAWSPRTGSRGGFGPAAPHRYNPLHLTHAGVGQCTQVVLSILAHS
jgi:hypothetical protein